MVIKTIDFCSRNDFLLTAFFSRPITSQLWNCYKSGNFFSTKIMSFYRVRNLFWTKNSSPFQGLSRTHFPFFKDSIQCKRGPWVYVFFSSSTTWVILSLRSSCFCSFLFGVLLKLLKLGLKFKVFPAPTAIFKEFQGLLRCMRTLFLLRASTLQTSSLLTIHLAS